MFRIIIFILAQLNKRKKENVFWWISVRTFSVMYDHTLSKLANHQIRHQATHKVGCQLGDFIWSFQSSLGVYMGMYGKHIHFIIPRGVKKDGRSVFILLTCCVLCAFRLRECESITAMSTTASYKLMHLAPSGGCGTEHWRWRGRVLWSFKHTYSAFKKVMVLFSIGNSANGKL